MLSMTEAIQTKEITKPLKIPSEAHTESQAMEPKASRSHYA